MLCLIQHDKEKFILTQGVKNIFFRKIIFLGKNILRSFYFLRSVHNGKTTPIGRIAVRETGVSLGIMGAQFRAPLKPLGPSKSTLILKV